MANEKRMIDGVVAETAIRNASEIIRAESSCEYDNGWADALSSAADMIKMIPTMDAVEVVRCKDCSCWMKDDPSDNFGYCINPDGIDNYAKPDDFCSYGERRTDGNT